MRSPRSLSGKSQFAAVFAEGRRARSDGLTVWALSQPAESGTRLGLSVGTSAGGAIARNRMRRRLRAIVRINPLSPADVVVRADRHTVLLSFQELEKHLLAALARVGAGES
ncbi:MAG: Ribonuclease [Actinomycetota bacterium]|jgi:ribonuclease P protein component|nr:Ribonuclease [Actinomycetota bacterium]